MLIGLIKLQNTEDDILKYKCVCCGHRTLVYKNTLEHEICPVCFWENDPIQNKQPEYDGGSNNMSLVKARENYHKYGAISTEFIRYVRAPNKDEI